jgi:hypothetical protein
MCLQEVAVEEKVTVPDGGTRFTSDFGRTFTDLDAGAWTATRGGYILVECRTSLADVAASAGAIIGGIVAACVLGCGYVVWKKCLYKKKYSGRHQDKPAVQQQVQMQPIGVPVGVPIGVQQQVQPMGSMQPVQAVVLQGTIVQQAPQQQMAPPQYSA